MKQGEIISFDDFIDALVSRIIDMCINVNQKTIPDAYKKQTVKTWTITKDVIVYPEEGEPQIKQESINYELIQCPYGDEFTYSMYTTNQIKKIIIKALEANDAYLTDTVMYVSSFTHMLKVLERFISENFKLVLSPFYKSSIILFSPTGDYSYDMTSDIECTGTNAYSQTQIETFFKNFSEYVIFYVPDDNIIILTYSVSYTVIPPVVYNKKNFVVTYAYTKGENKFTLCVELPSDATGDYNNIDVKLYYKNSMNETWKLLEEHKLTYGVQYLKTFTYDETTTTYIKVAPGYTETKDSRDYYNVIGNDNTVGYTLSKVETSSSSVLSTLYVPEDEKTECKPATGYYTAKTQEKCKTAIKEYGVKKLVAELNQKYPSECQDQYTNYMKFVDGLTYKWDSDYLIKYKLYKGYAFFKYRYHKTVTTGIFEWQGQELY